MQLAQARQEYGWSLVIRFPGGHRYFRNLDNDKVSACDNSGSRPHLTDDGVLYVDDKRPVVIGSNYGTVPVLHDDGSQAHVSEQPHHAVQLAQELGLEIKLTGWQSDFVRALLSAMTTGVKVSLQPEKN